MWAFNCVNIIIPALELAQNDPKTLFRRCQAYEGLKRYEEAYKDAMLVMKIDPKNKAIQQILMRLNPIIQERVDISLIFISIQQTGNNCSVHHDLRVTCTVVQMNKQASTTDRVTQMFDLTFDGQSADEEKRKTV